jgi:hypothetical protein
VYRSTAINPMDHVKQIAKRLGLKVGDWKGAGIHMHLQPYKSLNPGDFVWDADFGYMMYTGKGWYPFI